MALFSRQKKEKRKGQESTIGKIIYSFLLFMPILAVATACLYVVFNKNAYESYSDHYQQEYINVNESSKLIQNNEYSINLKTFKENTSNYTRLASGRFKYTNISINWNNYRPTNESAIPQGTLDTVNNFCVYYSTALVIKLYSDDTAVKTWYYTLNNIERYPTTIGDTIFLTISEFPTFSEGSFGQNYNTNAMYLITYQIGTLDNVFYYQLERLENSNLFNWTKNTGTYTVIHNTTTGLGITNTYMPMLLTYWLIVSVIYFIYDIGLMLVWVMHRKIHELQEEI